MTDQPHPEIVPVILAGGSGTRLWPLSRKSYPKQFLALTGEQSLYQEALMRAVAPLGATAPLVIGNDDYRFLMAEQARQVGIDLDALLLEPAARNTAPAVAVAALWVARKNPDALLHVLTADHAIEANEDYLAAVAAAAGAAVKGNIVTFGIEPDEPATGYGYIEAGDELTPGTVKVRRFVEKPDIRRAAEMLEAGGYYWNSGMFLFSAATMIAAFEALNPEILSVARQTLANAESDLDFIRLPAVPFETAEAISIDYAIAEKAANMAMVPAAFPWSDVGSWDSVWSINDGDERRNVARGPASFVNANRSLVVSDGVHVAVQGLDHVGVIATDDAILVTDLQNAQSVREVVAVLAKDEATAPLLENHTTSYRPWGGYSSIEVGDRFQVKRLFVDPGKKLSLQKHHHRAEHWVVVRGTAEVTIDDRTITLFENQSTYIPHGAVHRLANPGKIRLEVIEVQSGPYLGEDDIIRIEDDFGRG